MPWALLPARAAYESGQEWLEQLKLYLQENLKCMKDFLQTELPQAVLTEPEGTYLVWVDFSRLGYSPKDLDRFMSHKAKVWLDGEPCSVLAGKGSSDSISPAPEVY